VRTECSDLQLEFQGLNQRKVVAKFDGGRVSSDGGVLLLREVAQRTGLMKKLAACFEDRRRQDLVEFSVEELISQRVLAIALGYEDLNDHDSLRDDALIAAAAGKSDLTGLQRKREQDRGHALAGKSTLNRLELSAEQMGGSERYKKISYSAESIDRLLVDTFIEMHGPQPRRIVLDLDATDDPLYGKQEGRFFHGYYRHYCYLPLYITCGDDVLCARLRPSNIDGAAGTIDELERIIPQIRERWPKTQIIIRADSGFAREAIMAWCEANSVDYVLGLAKNDRLISAIGAELNKVREAHRISSKPERCYRDFTYKTRKSWSRTRRVVGKAEQLPGKSNPRFVVTSLPKSRLGARRLYEELYCARGDMENRIKEQQLGMFADRTSCATMRANQLRLYFSTMAYTLVNELRRCGLVGTQMERAQVGTIRCRLLKIGAIVRVSIRRVYVSLSSVYPLKELFIEVLASIKRAHPQLA
jgi:hypothetical protein